MSGLAQPKLAVFVALGIASGLPSPLLGDAVKTWMSESGIAMTQIAAASLLTLPLGLKFLWAPLFDRFAIPGFGRRRGWLLVTQAAVAGGLLLLANSDPLHLTHLGAVMLLLAFASASQDIVVDGYRADRLQGDDVALGSAAGVAGWRVGALLAQSVVFVFAEHVGWPAALRLMAAIHLLTLLPTLFAAEPTIVQPTGGFDATVVAPFRAFWVRHGRWSLALLAFAGCFKASDALAGSLAVPFLRELGYTNHDFSLRGALGMPMAIAGGVLGGLWLPRLGLVRALWLFGVLQAVSNLVYLLPWYGGPRFAWLLILVVVENLCGGLAVAAFMGFLVEQCERRWSATQYALLSAVMFLGAIQISSLAGVVQQMLGWPGFFLASVVIGLPGLVLLAVVTQRPSTSLPVT